MPHYHSTLTTISQPTHHRHLYHATTTTTSPPSPTTEHHTTTLSHHRHHRHLRQPSPKPPPTTTTTTTSLLFDSEIRVRLFLRFNSPKGEFGSEVQILQIAQETTKTGQTRTRERKERRNKRRTPNIVKPELRTIVEMADNRTMEELLQAPTEGYGEAINQSSTLGTLLSNTIPNLKGEMKAITTRSGVAYEGHSMPTPKKVVERETEEITDKDQTNFQGSTAHIQPSVTLIPEPDVPKTLPKLNIPYPSRLNDQKLGEKATNQMDKFFQIFQNLHFDISANALLLMPNFASTTKSLLTNKDKLFELATIPLNENCLAMLLKKLPEKLGDPGKFLIPCDFFGMDVCHALVDLGASINLMPLSIWKKLSLTKLTPTRMTLEEEYAQEILSFSNNSSGGNPTSTFEPILSDSSPFLTSFEGSDFILEKIDAYLKDESVSPEIDHANFDLEGDICLIEKLLNNDRFQLPLMDLKQGEVIKAKYLIEEPPELELKDLPSYLEYAYLEGVDKLPVIVAKDLKVDE
nr:reverse transcriptase domain-containing protein [Tanacetum cinerariifolium]